MTRASVKARTRVRSSSASSLISARAGRRRRLGVCGSGGGGVFDEEVVAGDVEDLGEADDGVGRR